MARIVKFKGGLTVTGPLGSPVVATLPIDKTTDELNEMIQLAFVVPKGTNDYEIPMGQLDYSLITTIEPSSPIQVKFNNNLNTPHTVKGPSVHDGRIDKIYVTTTPDLDVSISVILVGP